MLRITLGAAWSRKRRLAGTALAIVLGVAFLSATIVLGDSARAGFAVAFEEANEGIDAAVQSERELTAAEDVQRLPVDASLLDVVATHPGVAAAASVVEGRAQVLDADGSPIGGGGPPTVAAAWIDDPRLTGWDLRDGRAPAADGEVVVDAATAEEAGVVVGDALTVLVPRPIDVTVVGIAGFGDDDSIGGMTYVGFRLAEAQRVLLGGDDRISGVVASAERGVTQEALAGSLRDVLPDGVESMTGEELTAQMREDIEGDFLGFFTTALLAFAAVALLVATFSIFNTFSILVAQRTRESALLRAVGASRRQVLTSSLAESVLVGVVGAVVGAGAGVLVAGGVLALMEGAGFGMPSDGVVVTTGALVTAIAVGLLVTMVGGLVPAWRSSRVAPIAALRDVAVDTSATSKARAVAGIAVLGAGAGLVLADGALARVGLGGALALIGMVLLGPVVARPVGRLVSAPLRLRGVSGDLAARNAVRNPRRTAATASALLVGVGVVSLFAVFGSSVQSSIEEQVGRTFVGDLALTPSGGAWSGAGMSIELLDDLGALPEVDTIAGLGFGAATLDGRQQEVGFTRPLALAQVAAFEPVAGDVSTVRDADIALSDDYAEEHGYEIGDVIELGFADGTTAPVAVSAIFDPAGIGGDVLVTEALWAAHDPQPSYYVAFVDVADGVSLDVARTTIETASAGAGSPDVMDRDELIESQAAEIDVLLTVIYGLLGIAIVIAVMGIANTLSLSVHERTGELGLLRAVGQTRPQLRAMVRWESVVVAVFGSLGGVGLGMFLSWGLVRALNAAEGFGSYDVPVGTLVTVVVLGAVAGIAAGVRPASRAAKLDVLAAVAADR